MIRAARIGLSLSFFLYFIVNTAIAGTTPPTTSHELTGNEGNNGWWKSSVNVTLSVTDTETGPASTQYQLDEDSPTTIYHNLESIPQFENSSFELGNNESIWYWQPGYVDESVQYYQSSAQKYEGSYSAAIAGLNTGEQYYWHNEDNAVLLEVDSEYQVSAYLNSYLESGDDVYLEVWARNNAGTTHQLISTSSPNTLTQEWEELLTSFTVPQGLPFIYVKLYSTFNNSGIVYWDAVNIAKIESRTVEHSFVMSEEGIHTLSYFSTDNNGNVEESQETIIKKDTVIPNPWQNFVTTDGSCDHCYLSTVEVKDVISGSDVSTAEYRFYTEHKEQYWSGWLPVENVVETANGNDAVDGYQNLVTLETPDIDFGDSEADPLKLQFRLVDMAGNVSNSPVYIINGSWVQGLDGSIYVGGELNVPEPANGDDHANLEVMGQDIKRFTTSSNWMDGSYIHAWQGEGLQAVVPSYVKLQENAQVLQPNTLPTADGVYSIIGDLVLDNQSLADYETTSDLSVIILVSGNLNIQKNISVPPDNNAIFIIEGSMSINRSVEDIEGFYVVGGQFDSDPSGRSKKPLTVYGSVLALDGYILPRDLDDSGQVNNTNTPAEKFIWQPDYLDDETLIQLVRQQQAVYMWHEIESPPQ